VNGSCDYISPALCSEGTALPYFSLPYVPTCLHPFFAEIVAIGVSTGAIVGIVIGVAVCLALSAGAAYKVRQMYNAEEDLNSVGQSNPLYEMGEVGGSSAIYTAAEKL